MESRKLSNIDLGQAKPQTSIKQVANTPRKGRSSNLLPQLISEEGNTSRTERNRIGIDNQRASELLERNQRDSANMIIAIQQQVNNGELTSYGASKLYELDKKKIVRHAAAAREQGTDVPLIKKGRLPYFSNEVIEEEKIIISSKDSRLRSIFVDKFGDHLHGIQQKRYVGGVGVPPLKLMGPSSVLRYRKKIAPETITSYDQNASRVVALEDIYTHISWAVVLRIFHGRF
jgi:hypothetical protein